jgi:hypothetical protein
MVKTFIEDWLTGRLGMPKVLERYQQSWKIAISAVAPSLLPVLRAQWETMRKCQLAIFWTKSKS